MGACAAKTAGGAAEVKGWRAVEDVVALPCEEAWSDESASTGVAIAPGYAFGVYAPGRRSLAKIGGLANSTSLRKAARRARLVNFACVGVG